MVINNILVAFFFFIGGLSVAMIAYLFLNNTDIHKWIKEKIRVHRMLNTGPCSECKYGYHPKCLGKWGSEYNPCCCCPKALHIKNRLRFTSAEYFNRSDVRGTKLCKFEPKDENDD